MNKSIVQEKAYTFAVHIVRVYITIKNQKKEYVLSSQILRSGTAIGAIIEEALGGQSSKDFLSKISMAYKEARETEYWLRLLHEVQFIQEDEYRSLKGELDELLKMLGSIQMTMKKKLVRHEIKLNNS